MHAGVSHPVAQQAATTLAALSTTAAMKAAGYSPANGAVEVVPFDRSGLTDDLP